MTLFLLLLLQLSGSNVQGAQVPRARLDVRLAIAAELPLSEPVAVTLELHPLGGRAANLAPMIRTVQVLAPAVVTFDLTTGSTWEATATSAGFLCERRLVIPGAHQEITLTLLPKGFVSARLKAPRRNAFVDRIVARAEPTPVTAGGREAGFGLLESTCDVVESALRCEVPAGIIDLRIGSTGVVPLYRWGVHVAMGQVADLGEWAPLSGATVSGFVTGKAREAVEAPIRVGLAPLSQGEVDGASAIATGRTVEANERGFFIFPLVPAGDYEVSATCGDTAASPVGPVAVSEGLESHLRDALVLQTPVDVAVQVVPGLDSVGRPWRVRIVADKRQRRSRIFVVEAESDAVGRVTMPKVPPGQYRVLVRDVDGKIWAQIEESVEPAMSILEVRVEALAVGGTLRVGDKPSSGAVFFASATDSRTASFRCDAHGKFAGVLPGPGSWRVSVELPGVGGLQYVGVFDLSGDGGDANQALDIEVPDTRVPGEVVDEQGALVEGAVVTFTSFANDRPSLTTTGKDGAFGFRGVPPGPGTLHATHRLGECERIPLTVSTAGATSPVRLVIRARLEFRGVVMWRGRPVTGAQVHAVPDLATGGTANVLSATTDAKGAFALRFAKGVTRHHVLVTAPSLYSRLLAIERVPDREVDIPLDRDGGTLTVFAPKAAEGPKRLMSALLVHERAGLPVAMLVAMGLGAVSESGSDVICDLRDLEPGMYAVCPGDVMLVLRSLAVGASPPADLCSAGYLAPRGQLTLLLMR